jgi:hypothetical protein
MTDDENRSRFLHALMEDGWYGVFRTPDGIRRVAVSSWDVEDEDSDSGLTKTRPGFEVPIFDQPRDVLGRFTLLGVFHDVHQPEPEEAPWR